MVNLFFLRFYCANQRIILFAICTALLLGLTLWEGPSTLLCTSGEIKALGTSGIPQIYFKDMGSIRTPYDAIVTHQSDVPNSPRIDYKLVDLTEYHGPGRVLDWVFATDQGSIESLRRFQAHPPLNTSVFMTLLKGHPLPPDVGLRDPFQYFTLHVYHYGSHNVYNELAVHGSSAEYSTNLKRWLGSGCYNQNFYTILLDNGDSFPILRRPLGISAEEIEMDLSSLRHLEDLKTVRLFGAAAFGIGLISRCF
jgi:hypothetical protein